MIISTLIIIFGLCLFEVICSVDNAIINATVLKTMSVKYRRSSCSGEFSSLCLLSGACCPFVIVWATNPAFSLVEVFKHAYSSYAERLKPWKIKAPAASWRRRLSALCRPVLAVSGRKEIRFSGGALYPSSGVSGFMRLSRC